MVVSDPQCHSISSRLAELKLLFDRDISLLPATKSGQAKLSRRQGSHPKTAAQLIGPKHVMLEFAMGSSRTGQTVADWPSSGSAQRGWGFDAQPAATRSCPCRYWADHVSVRSGRRPQGALAAQSTGHRLRNGAHSSCDHSRLSLREAGGVGDEARRPHYAMRLLKAKAARTLPALGWRDRLRAVASRRTGELVVGFRGARAVQRTHPAPAVRANVDQPGCGREICGGCKSRV
eukprot:SAG11_NODE_310_length_10927_cov_19.887514_1_plen_233_part_00